MVAHDADRITLTCAGCGFVVSLSRFQAGVQGWRLSEDPPGLAWCSNCAAGEGVGERIGTDPERIRTKTVGAA